MVNDARTLMHWKPIEQLTDGEFDLADLEHRLILWNASTGPHHCDGFSEGYASAQDIRAEGVWERYLILPSPS